MDLQALRALRRRWTTSSSRTVRILRALFHEWHADRVAGLAAEVAFWGVLSVFPALLATAATLGILENFVGRDLADRAEERVVEYLRDILTQEASDTISAVENLFTSANPGLLTFSVLTAIWAVSRGFAAIIRALDVAYDLEEGRSFATTRLLAMGLALGSVLVGAAILGMVVVGPLFGTGHEVADAIGLGDVFATFWTWARWPVVLLVMVAWATTILHTAPNHRTPWRWDLPGAVLATVGWTLVSFGLRYYLAFSGDTNQVFGILGGSLIVLIWLYLLAVGLILGGELNAVLVQLGIAPPQQTEQVDPLATPTT